MFTAKIENLEKTKRLQYNLRLISNLCDNALSKDGMGFNKYDSDNAKSVSNKEILTWNDIKSILHYATKYSKQINLKDIPTSNELWNEFNSNSVNNMNIVNNQEITKTDFVNAELINDIIDISFQCKDRNKWNQIKEFITSFGKRRFDGYTKKWKITLNNSEVNKFKEFVKLFDVTINSKLTDYLNNNQNTVIENKITDISDLSLNDPIVATFNKNLFDYQKIGSLFALKNKKCLIGDEMGVGKAQSLDSLILTPNGYKKMGDIKINDDIINSDGLISQVIGIYPQGIKKMYKVTFSDNTTTKCCEDHLWSIQTNNDKQRNKDYQVKSLKEFKDDLYDKSNNKKYFIPIVKPIQFEKKDLKIDPYLLGALIGDGGLSNRSVNITTSDIELIDILNTKISDDIIIKKKSDKYSYGFIRKDKKQLNNSLKKHLKKYGLMGKLSNEKFIPKDFLYSDINDRIELLSGLLDTDGYISKNGCNVQYYTTSKSLKDDFCELVNGLSGVCRVREKIGKYKDKNGITKECLTCYVINVSLPSDIIPFKLSRRLERFKPKTKYQPIRMFKKVEFVGYELAQCIRVNSKDSLYLTDNYIVTHNTLTALQTFISSNSQKILIIVPATLKYNWKQEIYKHYSHFMTNKTLSVINSNKANKKSYCIDFNSDIVIINYDILDKFKDKLMSIKWDFIINDESHYIKNIKAKRTIALMDIANNSNSQYHLLLTGTPMLNRPKELVTQLQVINRLNDISASEFLFKLRYCDGQKTAFGWTFDGATHTQELREKLKKIMIRRTKKEVLTELPDKLIQEIFIDIDNRKEYDLKDKEFELLTKHELLELCTEFLKRNNIDIDFNNSSLVIETMEQNFETDYNYFLKQISNSAIHLTRITQLKKLLAHGKLNQAKEFIDNTIENEKLVVFANHIEIQKALHEMYPNALKIDSSTSQVKRQEIVNEYQNNPDQKLIILSLMSCNAGLTLTSASKMLILEYLWSPLLMSQAQDRIHRIGTKNTVNIYNMIALDTIESQEIYPLLMEKLDTITQILDGLEIDNETNMQVSFLKRFIEKRIKHSVKS